MFVDGYYYRDYQGVDFDRKTLAEQVKKSGKNCLFFIGETVQILPNKKIRTDLYNLSGTIMFMVGEVFPYIRSHNVLNNLQKVAKEKPTVMFFPGVYTHSLEFGASLDLFGRLHEDRYYRAFNIYHCEA